MTCVVCPSTGQPVTRALNGAPLGVLLCVDCYEAVRRREVGITSDGHVTDGRHVQRPAETPAQPRLDL